MIKVVSGPNPIEGFQGNFGEEFEDCGKDSTHNLPSACHWRAGETLHIGTWPMSRVAVIPGGRSEPLKYPPYAYSANPISQPPQQTY
jgi:hypothetical protein